MHEPCYSSSTFIVSKALKALQGSKSSKLKAQNYDKKHYKALNYNSKGSKRRKHYKRKEWKNKCNQRQRLSIQEEILCECKCESIRALCVAKEWEGTPCSVQNVNTGYTRCSGFRGSLTREKDFTCKKCIPGVVFEDEDKMISLDGGNIEVVDRFSYLGDVISTERRCSGGCNIKN